MSEINRRNVNNGDSGCTTFGPFPADWSEREMIEVLEDHGECVEPCNGGPGRYFQHRPMFYRNPGTGGAQFVAISWGYDI